MARKGKKSKQRRKLVKKLAKKVIKKAKKEAKKKKKETFMAVECPICKSSAQELLHTGDATAFHCPTHGDFKVANTVFEEAEAKDYTREEWEAALDKAKQRAEPDEDEWAVVTVDDFS